MRQSMLCLVGMCAIELFMMGCAPDSVGVVVHVKNAPPNLRSLHVDAVLDGKAAMQSADFSNYLDQFTIKLPSNAIGPTGEGFLSISITGVDSERCKVTKDRRDISIRKDSVRIDIDSFLSPLPNRLCADFSRTSFDVGQGPYHLAAGDFDADQRLDLAVVNNTGDSVSVLLGDGLGGFAAAKNFATSANPYAVAVGDFNNDRQSDLAVAAKDISILLGDGKGGFGTAINYNSGGAQASALVVADFNKDGQPDLAVTNPPPSSNVCVLIGNPNGTFKQPPVCGGFGAVRSLAAGDIDRDGTLDLAVTEGPDRKLRVLFGDGTGAFPMYNGFDTNGATHFVAMDDLDGDQDLDLAVTLSGTNQVAVLLGDGAGRFQITSTPTVGTEPYAVVARDLNNDQRVDLAISNGGSNTVSVLMGNGMGGFGPATNFTAGSNPTSIAVGDFNGDRKPDLAVTNFQNGRGNGITVLLNQSL